MVMPMVTGSTIAITATTDTMVASSSLTVTTANTRTSVVMAAVMVTDSLLQA